jgi:hypothetical protein
VDRETGEEMWRIQTGAYVYSSPVVVGYTLYVGQGDGDVVALDTDSGVELWSYRTGGAVYSTPLVHQGRIYVGSDDGFVYAFQAAEDRPLVRAVFFDERLRSLATFGQADAHLAAREFFVDRGYTLLDSEGLADFLEDRISHSAPSVVVFAMDALPEEVGDAGPGEPPLLRRYLEAGGKAVWMGYPPGYLVRDPQNGQVLRVDRSAPTRLTGVDFDAFLGDSYGIRPTEEGRLWGLTERWVGSGSTLPSEVSQLLASDELGRAAAWVKSYGGAPGTGFIFLRSATSAAALSQIQRAAEYSGYPRTPTGG